MVLIAPAIVEGVTRLEVGTFVEIQTVGVESASAATGVESADSVDPELVVTVGTTDWPACSGSTFKFAGPGIVLAEDALFKS